VPEINRRTHTFANTYHLRASAATVGGHSELGVAALLEAVWWGMHLTSLLTQLFLYWLVCWLVSQSV